MKRLLLLVFMLVLAGPVFAQVGTPNNGLGWDQPGPDLATVQAYTYRYYADGAATGVTFPSVVCMGASSPFACRANFPAFTPGNHTVQITAGNVAGESAKSAPFGFVFVVQPAVPFNLRIEP